MGFKLRSRLEYLSIEPNLNENKKVFGIFSILALLGLVVFAIMGIFLKNNCKSGLI